MGQKDKLVELLVGGYGYERQLVIPVVEEVVGQGMAIDNLDSSAAYINENYWKMMGGKED